MVKMLLLLLFMLVSASESLRFVETNRFDTGNNSITEDGDYYYFLSTGMPNHPYDSNISMTIPEPQDYQWTIPKKPVMRTDGPSCLPRSIIGFSLAGVPFFSVYTTGGEDAVQVEIFDNCAGHADATGAYHYHQMSPCFLANESSTPINRLMGVALDGVPIYGPWDASGTELTNDDLDECNGHTTTIGDVTQYVYRLTEDFPYTLGCFKYEVPTYPNLTPGPGACQ